MAAPRPEPLLPRHPGDAVRLAAAVAIFAASAALVYLHRDRVGVLETDVFRLVNDLPGWLYPGMWVVMQAGNLVGVGVAAGLAAAARRYRLAVNLAVAGTGVWFLAKAVKLAVARGRPSAPGLLTHVHVHGPAAGGLGFVSGHAAVAVALASVASPYLGRRARRLAWAAADGVCLSRMYVGAHLPLDVVGGAALGWAAGALVHLLLGAPGGRPSPARAGRALAEHGLEPLRVTPLGGRDARRSARFQATTTGGRELFVKLIPRERRDADLLYRAWRWLLRRAVEPGRSAAGPPSEQVEREAYLGLLAAAAGVRTPAVLLAAPFGNGAGVLVQEWIPGRSLEETPPGEVDEQRLRATWRQVARLHAAGIAHGDLTRASVVVDDRGESWLVDFDHAEAAAGERPRQRDVAELLVSLAARFGVEPAAAAAAAELGADAVDLALGAARPRELTPAGRRELHAHPGLLQALRAAARPAAGAPTPH
ncbi:MAG TPA: phosphatase PAP2 family protein [Actinomycetes bacterium]|nr:phosphatase PAP2 family protein [Actinomycetes bacterium]